MKTVTVGDFFPLYELNISILLLFSQILAHILTENAFFFLKGYSEVCSGEL